MGHSVNWNTGINPFEQDVAAADMSLIQIKGATKTVGWFRHSDQELGYQLVVQRKGKPYNDGVTFPQNNSSTPHGTDEISGDTQFLPSNLSPRSGSVWELLEAIADCRFKAHLRLQGEVGAKMDDEVLFGELREAVKRKAIDEISLSGGVDGLFMGTLLSTAALR